MSSMPLLTITWGSPPPRPPSPSRPARNYPPTIAWVTPTNGFSAIVPANLALQVTATDPQNEVTLVTITDQYGDTLYTSTSPTGPYSTTWTAGVGTYNLTATVYDQHGASRFGDDPGSPASRARPRAWR